jgi:hypothetical protein
MITTRVASQSGNFVVAGEPLQGGFGAILIPGPGIWGRLATIMTRVL